MLQVNEQFQVNEISTGRDPGKNFCSNYGEEITLQAQHLNEPEETGKMLVRMASPWEGGYCISDAKWGVWSKCHRLER